MFFHIVSFICICSYLFFLLFSPFPSHSHFRLFTLLSYSPEAWQHAIPYLLCVLHASSHFFIAWICPFHRTSHRFPRKKWRLKLHYCRPSLSYWSEQGGNRAVGFDRLIDYFSDFSYPP